MQPRRDKIPGCSHLPGYLSVARLVWANEAQASKLMEELQIENSKEKHYGNRLQLLSNRGGRKNRFGLVGLARFRQ